MKNKKLVGVLAVVVTAITLTSIATSRKAPPQADLGGILGMVNSQVHFFNSAWAAGDSSCDEAATAAVQACVTANAAYQHGALNYFNNMLCLLNNQSAAIAENALCHFTKSMGMNPDKGALPQTITQTFDGKSISLEVVAPTESFASTLGYDAKATVKVDGTTFMVIYWGGSEATSSGFLIQGPTGIGSGKNPMYIQWSRKDSENQFVKVLFTNFTTSYLGAINGGSGDTAMYGKATYNASTKAVSTQMVRIEGQRGGTATTKACFRMLAEGTKGGTVTVIKTDNAHGSTGHASTHNTTTITDETDAFQGVDSETTANLTGNTTTAASGVTTPFDKTCKYLDDAGGAGQPFAGNTVDFAAAPTTIFP